MRISNTCTTGSSPSIYHDYYEVQNSGTATQPMIVCGVADAQGNLLIMDGTNAKAQSDVNTTPGGGIITLWPPSHFGYWQSRSAGPRYVSITGLDPRNANSTIPHYEPGSQTRMCENSGIGSGIVTKRHSRLGSLLFVAVALTIACLRAVPLFAADSVPRARLQEVNVPGTHPLGASAVDLARYGYQEQEYYASGTANRYRIKKPLDAATLVDSDHAYKARIVVRKPSDPKRFNGVVIVEWYNVSAGQDIDFCWGGSYDYLIREGYAWVGVSAQRVGIKQLNAWNPARYGTLSADASNDDPQGGTLDDRGDVLSWDIFSQVGAAILSHQGPNDPLVGLVIKRLIAAGESQSALRLTAYYNSIQPLHNLYQGFLYYDAAGSLRSEARVPAISVGTEFGAAFPAIAATGDTPFLRRWPVAGTSHVSFQEMDGYIDVETLRDGFLKSPDGKPVSLTQATPGCKQTPLWSRVPTELVLNSAYEHLDRWIKDGTAAPAAPQFERNPDGSLKRDADGALLGGIRMPQFAVPTGQNSGFNSGPGTCMLAGYHRDYSPAELTARYHDHAGYVREVDKATQEVLKVGFILPYDAEQIRKSANASNVFQKSGAGVNTDRRADSGIEVQELMRADASWNGVAYGAYPQGTAEPVVAKITIPAHQELNWHSHPMPSFAYVLSGEITVEDKEGNKKRFTAGDVMPETVNTVHRGMVGDQPATFIVFYVRTKGMPLSRLAE
jgi:quercetin dioxygenase-like cupin family protein